MELQELEITIGKDGETRICVRGVKGSECVEMTRELEAQLGELRERQYTEEYYEAPVRETERTKLSRR